VGLCDVVTINAPLHPETEGLFDDELIGKTKPHHGMTPHTSGTRVVAASYDLGWSGPADSMEDQHPCERLSRQNSTRPRLS
jgi:hypothetical protein